MEQKNIYRQGEIEWLNQMHSIQQSHNGTGGGSRFLAGTYDTYVNVHNWGLVLIFAHTYVHK